MKSVKKTAQKCEENEKCEENGSKVWRKWKVWRKQLKSVKKTEYQFELKYKIVIKDANYEESQWMYGSR